MSIVVLQTFKAAEGRYNELAQVITAMLPETAAREGAQHILAAGDPAGGVVTVYEQWESPAALQAYVAWRTPRTDISALMALLREPPQIQQWSRLF